MAGDSDVSTAAGYRQAMAILDAEWVALGVTREELQQDERLTEILQSLLISGRSFDDINAEWSQKTPEQILREYASAEAR